MEASNFANMTMRISRMHPQMGGFHFGEVHVRNLEALAYWIHDKGHRNEVIDARDFTVAVRNEC
jgi:hypothetical protein